MTKKQKGGNNNNPAMSIVGQIIQDQNGGIRVVFPEHANSIGLFQTALGIVMSAVLEKAMSGEINEDGSFKKSPIIQATPKIVVPNQQGHA